MKVLKISKHDINVTNKRVGKNRWKCSFSHNIKWRSPWLKKRKWEHGQKEGIELKCLVVSLWRDFGSDPPSPELGELPMVRKIWEQKTFWSCILGEPKNGSCLTDSPVPTTQEVVKEKWLCEYSGSQLERVSVILTSKLSLKESHSFYRPKRLRMFSLRNRVRIGLDKWRKFI